MFTRESLCPCVCLRESVFEKLRVWESESSRECVFESVCVCEGVCLSVCVACAGTAAESKRES